MGAGGIENRQKSIKIDRVDDFRSNSINSDQLRSIPIDFNFDEV